MKNSLKKTIFTLVVMFMAYGAFAQDQSVTLGTTHTYSVTNTSGLTYTWTVDAAGTSTDVSTDTDNSIDILWDGVTGDYNITLFATDAEGCITETQTVTIRVLGQSSVMFAAATVDAETCSDLVSGDAGGTSSGGSSDFIVEFTSGLAPYDIIYKVVAPDLTETEYTKTNVPANYTIQIDNGFANLTSSSVDYKVVIVSAKTEDGATVLVDVDVADNTRTITVLPKPVISGTITLN